MPRKIIFIRFVGKQIDLDSGNLKGLFTIAYDLIREGNLDKYEESAIQESLKWFKMNLPIPDKFSKNRNNYHKNNLSTTRVKDSAVEVIRELMHLKVLIENAGVVIDICRTENPGYIIYEDEFQVVVTPHARRKLSIR